MNSRIVELRTALKLSQNEFGERIGLSRSGLADVERGHRPVQDRHIKLILAAFPQVSEEWLREGVGEMFVRDDNPIRNIMKKHGFPAIVEKLLTAYDHLAPDEQAAVLKYATEFVTEIVASAEQPLRIPTEEEEIDAEVERYRQQLLSQKMASSRSSGTDSTAENRA